MLTDLAERGEFDLVTDFADQLPMRVLAEMVGVPSGDREFARLFNKLAVANLDVVTHGIGNQTEEFKRAREGVNQIFEALIEARRAHPEDDLISKLLAAETPGDPLTTEEIRGLCLTLFTGGLEPGEFLICSAINALWKYPEQAERLRSEPELRGPGGSGGSAIEEFLRYDSPIHLIGRVVREDVEMDGQKMRKGQLVALNLGAANRDPEVYDQPHRLDLGRSPNPHLALGHGIHRCLGAPVARMLGSVAIPALVTRFPDLRPTGEIVREHSPHVQHFKTMPVALN
jgi:cytochrome P450